MSEEQAAQGQAESPAQETHELPYIERAVLIDPRRIELYWNTQVTGADRETVFDVRWDGEQVPLVHWRYDDDWNYGTVYELWSQRTTVALEEPVDVDHAEKLTVRVKREVVDYYDGVADTERVYTCVYDPHYKHFLTSKAGIPIKAPGDVPMEALQIVADTCDLMLEKHPEIGVSIVESGADVALTSLKGDIYDAPEHRMGSRVLLRPCGGFGGEPTNPTNAFMTNCIIRLRSGRYATRYPYENILVHEFGHAVHLIGMRHLEDQTLFCRVQACYDNAVEHGLWPNTYAISNFDEYFATLSTVWFNFMAEGIDGTCDGIRGPVNTREELAVYDPMGYELMAEVYTDKFLPYPWDTNCDDYDIDGNPRRDLSRERPAVQLDWANLV